MIKCENCRYRLVISLSCGSLGWTLLKHPEPSHSAKASVDKTWVLFTVFDGARADKTEEPVALIEAEPDSIGLPLDFAGALEAVADEPYRLPAYVVAGLKRVIVVDARSPETVWIEFEKPAGYLPAIPWERLLWEWCGMPSIRMAPGAAPAFIPPAQLDAVLCFSCPLTPGSDWTAERIVELFIRMMPKAKSQRSTTLHIFADKDSRPILQKSLSRFATMTRVLIYSPRPDAAYLDLETANSASRKAPKDRMRQAWLQIGHTAKRAVRALAREAPPATPLENPWLVWMRDELSDISVDYIHFVCHGYVGRESGGLVFANAFTTDDPRWSRYVSPRELNDFLSRVGAWSIGASSPPNDSATGGMRYLLDDLSSFRTGPILLHDMRVDEQHDALHTGYRIFADPTFTGSPAISAWWHPDRVADSETPELRNVPAWVVKTQRAIDLTSAAVARIPQTDYDAALLKGVAAALSVTSGFLADTIETNSGKER